MFKIEHRNQGYQISIGDGRPAFAMNLAGIHAALDHYYGASSTHYQRTIKVCPFCQQQTDAENVARERAMRS